MENEQISTDNELVKDKEPELEKEDTMESLLDEYVPIKQLRRGEIIDGKIMDLREDGVLVDIGYKSEGYIPLREIKTIETEDREKLSVGSEIIAYVVNVESMDGVTILSVDRARGEQGWRILEKRMELNENVSVKIIGAN